VLIETPPIDSFYEILLKAFIMYGDPADLAMFTESYKKETTVMFGIQLSFPCVKKLFILIINFLFAATVPVRHR
jgi:hypothetical protein